MGTHLVKGLLGDRHRLHCSCNLEGLGQLERQLGRNSDVYKGVRGTPEPKGVCGCGGLAPDAKQAHQAV